MPLTNIGYHLSLHGKGGIILDTSAWIELAIERMYEKAPGSPAFELKDLFTGDEWNQLSTGEKSTLGKVFATAVRRQEIEGIRFAPISKNGRHNKYEVF